MRVTIHANTAHACGVETAHYLLFIYVLISCAVRYISYMHVFKVSFRSSLVEHSISSLVVMISHASVSLRERDPYESVELQR